MQAFIIIIIMMNKKLKNKEPINERDKSV